MVTTKTKVKVKKDGNIITFSIDDNELKMSLTALTGIVPIGSPQHRQVMLESCQKLGAYLMLEGLSSIEIEREA